MGRNPTPALLCILPRTHLYDPAHLQQGIWEGHSGGGVCWLLLDAAPLLSQNSVSDLLQQSNAGRQAQAPINDWQPVSSKAQAGRHAAGRWEGGKQTRRSPLGPSSTQRPLTSPAQPSPATCLPQPSGSPTRLSACPPACLPTHRYFFLLGQLPHLHAQVGINGLALA